jgi:hypothetical protein
VASPTSPAARPRRGFPAAPIQRILGIAAQFGRWVDHRDGRRFGFEATRNLRLSPSKFRADFAESRVGKRVPATLNQAVAALSRNLAPGDPRAASQVFAEDGILEDLTLHAQVPGRPSTAGYLRRGIAALPYGHGAYVRHIVGDTSGGGFEWTNSSRPVPRGVNAAELNAEGQITRLSPSGTACWPIAAASPSPWPRPSSNEKALWDPTGN